MKRGDVGWWVVLGCKFCCEVFSLARRTCLFVAWYSLVCCVCLEFVDVCFLSWEFVGVCCRCEVKMLFL